MSSSNSSVWNLRFRRATAARKRGSAPEPEPLPPHLIESVRRVDPRVWLESTGWDKTPPAPALPPDVVEATSRRYLEAYERLTGRTLAI